MLFLIEYHRKLGTIVTMREFDDSERRNAEDSRLEMELELIRRGIEHEVVLLDASSEEALQRTHRRYFEDLAELMKSPHGT